MRCSVAAPRLYAGHVPAHRGLAPTATLRRRSAAEGTQAP